MRNKKEPAHDSMKGEIIFFRTPGRIRPCGFLSRPRRTTKRMVLHIHGLQGSFYSSTGIRYLAGFFTRKGFNFLSIEQRGSYIVNDAWKGGRKGRVILMGGALEKFEDSADDIEGAIRFARKIGMKRIYLEGHSTGCQKATYYLSRFPKRIVKGLILIAPDDDYNIARKNLGRKFADAVAVAKKLSKKDRNTIMPRSCMRGVTGASRFLSYADPKNAESRIFNYDLSRLEAFRKVDVPVLAIFGTREDYALKPVKEYLAILEKNSGTGMFTGALINGAGHNFRRKEKPLAREISRWLGEQEAKPV